MGSNPIIGSLENAISRWKIVRIRDFIGHARSRTKTHENARKARLSIKYSSSQIGDEKGRLEDSCAHCGVWRSAQRAIQETTAPVSILSSCGFFA
jgi:hypothetical protein